MQLRMHATLVKKLRDLLTNYRAIQTQYKEKSKEAFKKTAETMNPGITPKEVDALLASGDSTALFTEQINLKRNQAKNALNFIQQQQKEIQHLEQNLVLLHELFVDVSSLVEAQSEELNKIQEKIAETTTETTYAATNVTVAERNTRKRRRTVTIVVVIVLIVAVIIGLLIAGKVMGVY